VDLQERARAAEGRAARHGRRAGGRRGSFSRRFSFARFVGLSRFLRHALSRASYFPHRIAQNSTHTIFFLDMSYFTASVGATFWPLML
jgi:hypothetical protein